MRFFACRGCAAKDAEIARLWAMLRDAKGFVTLPVEASTANPVPAYMGQAASALAPEVELWLDARFVRGTPLHRQQAREALKLAVEGVASERIIDILARGQQLDL